MKIYHIRSKFAWLSLCLAILIASCSVMQRETFVDDSFLTGLPCTAPCWQGLELDISSKSDVLAKLQELTFVDQRSIKEYGTPWMDDDNAVGIRFNCTFSNGLCGEFKLSNDELKNMYFPIEFSLTFGEVVKMLGKPDYITTGVCQPEKPDCTVGLNWPEKEIYVGTHGYDVDLCTAMENGFKIPSETKVTDIAYSVKEAFMSVEGSCLQQLPWPGFLP